MNAPAEPLNTSPLTEGTSFHLVSLLENRLPSLRRRPKRVRTRAQILAATAREMERVGYEGLTVDTITEAAGIARGTFYLHFKDRSQVAMAVMRIFIVLRRRMRPRGGYQLTLRESIYRVNAYYVSIYAINAKLLLGRQSLLRDRHELVQLDDRINDHLATSIVRNILARQPHNRDDLDSDQLTLRVRCAIAMFDELLREIYLYRAASLARFVDDEPAVVKALSEVWYRAMLPEKDIRT